MVLTVLATGWLISNRGRPLADKTPVVQVDRSGGPNDLVDEASGTASLPSFPIRATVPGTAVATVTRVIDASCAPGSLFPTELSRLRIGQSLELEAGQIELLFDAGVEVILEGRTHFEIRSAASVYSRIGSISARVGEEREGSPSRLPTRV